MSLFNQNNLNVSKVAAKNEGAHPELTGVFVKPDKVVATDTFRLVEISTPANVKVDDYPKMPSGKTAMRGFKPFIVSAKEFGKIKIPNSKSLPVLNHVAVSYADDKRVEFLTTDLMKEEVKGLTKIEGKFPDYEKIFPTDKPVAELQVNANYLVEVLEVIGKLSRTATVKIKMYKNGQPMVLEAMGDNQEARGLLMPLRD